MERRHNLQIKDRPLAEQFERRPDVERFLNALEKLCREHGFSISHEDCHGGFIVEKFDARNIDWLRGASVDLPPYIDPNEPL